MKKGPKPKHQIWDGTDWDDGIVDARIRFRVRRPDYPRCYYAGMAYRSHVVWWLEHGTVHPAGTHLHHKDGNTLNDRLENLEVVSLKEHAQRHYEKYPRISKLLKGVKRSPEVCAKMKEAWIGRRQRMGLPAAT